MPGSDPRRLLRQQLESWNAAGVTHLFRLPAAGGAVPAESATGTAAVAAVPTEPTPNPSSAASCEVPVPRSASRPSPANGLFAERAPAAAAAGASAATRERRVEMLTILADAVRSCTRCDELARTRTQTVFGVGNPQAKILFIGEAPGADEDRQGEPFVGRAGQLLNQIIAACRLKREEIYICNILKCRPPENRTPLPAECGHCREYLDGQLAAVDPEYIVCWGTVAAQNLLATDATIGKLRRRFYRHGRAKVLCTYHPSYLLRNPAAKKDVWDDMKFLFADMGIDLSRKE